MSQNQYLENTCRTPNMYYDLFLYLLTPEEWVILSYTDRHTIGWEDIRKTGKLIRRISLDEYVNGVWNPKTNNRSDNGTGLSKTAVQKAQSELLKYGFLKKINDADPKNHAGMEVELIIDFAKIDMLGLKLRKENQGILNRKRSISARKKLEENREVRIVRQAEVENDARIVGQTGVRTVGQTEPRIVGQYDMYNKQ
jgi:hypothetical protein